MSLGALSPEAHRAIAIGMRRLGAASNTGEGGEDEAWYQPDDNGELAESAIKQVASARFGVTARYLARAEQLEIKIAQGSKPGEGGQLPAAKATAFIAALRRGRPGATMISPPPHHDIYSIEDLAELIADLRAINPAARIGVKLVAGGGSARSQPAWPRPRADYILVAGHAGGTGRQPTVVDQVGRPALGAGPGRGPPGPRPPAPPGPARRAHGRRAPDRPGRARRRPARRRGVRLRDRGPGRDRLRHGPPVPPRHLPDRDRHPARGPAGEVHGTPEQVVAFFTGPRRGRPARACRGGLRQPRRGDRPIRPAGGRARCAPWTSSRWSVPRPGRFRPPAASPVPADGHRSDRHRRHPRSRPAWLRAVAGSRTGRVVDLVAEVTTAERAVGAALSGQLERARDRGERSSGQHQPAPHRRRRPEPWGIPQPGHPDRAGRPGQRLLRQGTIGRHDRRPAAGRGG